MNTLLLLTIILRINLQKYVQTKFQVTKENNKHMDRHRVEYYYDNNKMIHEETVINDNYKVNPGMPEKIIKS